MNSIPAIATIPAEKLCLTIPETARALRVSEWFVAHRIRVFGLRARLLRPDITRIAVSDLQDWIERLRSRTEWKRQLQGKAPKSQKASDTTVHVAPERFMTYAGVADVLSVSYETVRNLVRDNGLPVTWLADRMPRVDPAALAFWVRTRPFRLAQCPNPVPRGRRPSPKPRKSAYVDVPGGGWTIKAEAQPEVQSLNSQP